MIKEEKFLDRHIKIRGKFSNIIKQISDSELMYNKKYLKAERKVHQNIWFQKKVFINFIYQHIDWSSL